MEARRREAEDEQGLKPLRRGWCWGIEEFRRKMLELMERKLGVGRTNLRSDVLPSASPPRSVLCPPLLASSQSFSERPRCSE